MLFAEPPPPPPSAGLLTLPLPYRTLTSLPPPPPPSILQHPSRGPVNSAQEPGPGNGKYLQPLSFPVVPAPPAPQLCLQREQRGYKTRLQRRLLAHTGRSVDAQCRTTPGAVIYDASLQLRTSRVTFNCNSLVDFFETEMLVLGTRFNLGLERHVSNRKSILRHSQSSV